jgi:hypothetical protein
MWRICIWVQIMENSEYCLTFHACTPNYYKAERHSGSVLTYLQANMLNAGGGVISRGLDPHIHKVQADIRASHSSIGDWTGICSAVKSDHCVMYRPRINFRVLSRRIWHYEARATKDDVTILHRDNYRTQASSRYGVLTKTVRSTTQVLRSLLFLKTNTDLHGTFAYLGERDRDYT